VDGCWRRGRVRSGGGKYPDDGRLGPPDLHSYPSFRPNVSNTLVSHPFDASDPFILHRSSLNPFLPPLLPSLLPSLPPSFPPHPPEFISEYLAKQPGWFQRCNVRQNMALLESLSRLRMLRRVTDLNGRVVPTTRMIRDWKREEARKNEAARKACAADRQQRRREWAAALASTAGKGAGMGTERLMCGDGGGGGEGGGGGAGPSSPAPAKRSALHTPLR
jgi:hypothetical protein